MLDQKNKVGRLLEWSIGVIAFVALAVTGRAEAALNDQPVEKNSVDFVGGGFAYVDLDDVINDNDPPPKSE